MSRRDVERGKEEGNKLKPRMMGKWALNRITIEDEQKTIANKSLRFDIFLECFHFCHFARNKQLLCVVQSRKKH